MELVDDKGKPLSTSKTPAQVREKLESIIPENETQREILFKAIVERLEKNRREKMMRGLQTGFDGTFDDNARIKAKSDGFTDERGFRLVAKIPREMFFVAKEVYGDDVIKDDSKFKEAFVKDPVGQKCLTVDSRGV